MDFIVYDKAPVSRFYDLHVFKVPILAGPIGQNLIGTDCNWPYLLLFSRILSNHVVRKVCLGLDFVYPLVYGNDVWT